MKTKNYPTLVVSSPRAIPIPKTISIPPTNTRSSHSIIPPSFVTRCCFSRSFHAHTPWFCIESLAVTLFFCPRQALYVSTRFRRRRQSLFMFIRGRIYWPAKAYFMLPAMRLYALMAFSCRVRARRNRKSRWLFSFRQIKKFSYNQI